MNNKSQNNQQPCNQQSSGNKKSSEGSMFEPNLDGIPTGYPGGHVIKKPQTLGPVAASSPCVVAALTSSSPIQIIRAAQASGKPIPVDPPPKPPHHYAKYMMNLEAPSASQSDLDDCSVLQKREEEEEAKSMAKVKEELKAFEDVTANDPTYRLDDSKLSSSGSSNNESRDQGNGGNISTLSNEGEGDKHGSISKMMTEHPHSMDDDDSESSKYSDLSDEDDDQQDRRKKSKKKKTQGDLVSDSSDSDDKDKANDQNDKDNEEGEEDDDNTTSAMPLPPSQYINSFTNQSWNAFLLSSKHEKSDDVEGGEEFENFHPPSLISECLPYISFGLQCPRVCSKKSIESTCDDKRSEILHSLHSTNSQSGMNCNNNSSDEIVQSLESQGIQSILTPLNSQTNNNTLSTQDERRSQMRKLNHSITVSFLDLIDILITSQPDKASQSLSQKIEDINLLFINLHHLINQFRPHQARETLRVMMHVQRRKRDITNDKLKSALVKAKSIVRGGVDELRSSTFPEERRVQTMLGISNRSKMDDT